MSEQRTPMQGLTPGRVVHYVLSAKDGVREWSVGTMRSATIITIEDDQEGIVTLNVNIDGFYDVPYIQEREGDELRAWQIPTNLRAPERPFSEEGAPGTWHWIPRA